MCNYQSRLLCNHDLITIIFLITILVLTIPITVNKSWGPKLLYDLQLNFCKILVNIILLVILKSNENKILIDHIWTWSRAYKILAILRQDSIQNLVRIISLVWVLFWRLTYIWVDILKWLTSQLRSTILIYLRFFIFQRWNTK